MARTVWVFIDFDNLYYSIKNHYFVDPNVNQMIQTIRSLAGELGDLQGMRARFGLGGDLPQGMMMTLQLAGVLTDPVPEITEQGRRLKERTDKYLIVDMMECLFEKDPDIMVVVAGDSDFSPVIESVTRHGKDFRIFALRKSLAFELAFSYHTQDKVVPLDDYVMPTPQAPAVGLAPVSYVRSREGVNPQAEEQDFRRLLVGMLEHVIDNEYTHISKGRLIDALKVSGSSEIAQEWSLLLDRAGEAHVVEAEARRMPDGTEKLHYRPNFASPLTARTVFYLVSLVRKLDTYARAGDGYATRAQLVGEGEAVAASPDRNVWEQLVVSQLPLMYELCVERGVILPQDQDAARCRLNREHPLVAYALNPVAPVVHLMNRVEAEMGYDWVTKSIFITELRDVLSQPLNTVLESLKREGLIREDSRMVKGRRRVGFILERNHSTARWLLGDFTQSAITFDWDDLSPRPQEQVLTVLRRLGEMTSRQSEREVPAKTLADALSQVDPKSDWNQALKLAKRVGVVEERKAPSSRGDWMARLFRLNLSHPLVQELLPQKTASPSEPPVETLPEDQSQADKEGKLSGISRKALAISGSAKKRLKIPGLTKKS